MVNSTGGDAFYHHHHRPLEQQFNQCSFHHSNSQYNHHDNGFCNYDQNSNQYHHMNGDLNNSYRGWEPWSNNGDSGYGSNHSTPHSGRKRGWLHSDRPTSPGPDQLDGITHAKLYVAPVPKTATESDIRTVFEGHGVIVEVVLLKDKRTGHRQGSCFVKYETLDEADRAIRALNNQYTFAGESSPIVVRFADGELERLGVADKVFVSSFSSYVSRKDIEEVFSLYGQVEYIYLARERGYAFVKFSSREMASASIKGLNGVFTMKGCHRPLIVRFADPKKPKAGEQRGNYLSGSAQFGPCSQEPVVRPPLNYGDPNGVSPMPMAPHYSSTPHAQLAPHMQNWEPAGTVVQQKFPPQQPPLQFAPMSVQPVQAPKLSPQPVVTEVQTQWHPADSSAQNTEQQISSQTGNSVLTIASSASPDMIGSLQVETYPECDWSEHISPDGDKYYFNCVTSESRWDKPEEYALYENGAQKQHELEDHSCHHSQSSLPSQEVAQRQQETNHVQVQSQTSPVVSQV